MTVAVLMGIAGPLLVVCATWALMTRTFRRDPRKLTSVMMAAFAGKMAFFAVYVTLALAVFSVQRVPFIVAFTASFIVLYVMQAIRLRRLLAGILNGTLRS